MLPTALITKNKNASDFRLTLTTESHHSLNCKIGLDFIMYMHCVFCELGVDLFF
jgi:hypothetical protein